LSFQGFNAKDFEVFHVDGLDERMEAIQERIQPKFQSIGEELTDDLSALAGNEMFLHIAKHARRKVNPPEDTWLAIAANKRGYKKHPHFQVGLFDDHVFIWLAFINELDNKKEIGQTFLDNITEIKATVPNEYVISLDHTKKDAYSMESLRDEGLENSLQRFRDVKKAEFLVGRHIALNDPIVKDGNEFLNLAKETFETLMPLYKLPYA
jgi:uncharacterized protein YktB (UPF0637 family)